MAEIAATAHAYDAAYGGYGGRSHTLSDAAGQHLAQGIHAVLCRAEELTELDSGSCSSGSLRSTVSLIIRRLAGC